MLNFHEKILESWCPEKASRAINESALVLVHECPHFFSAALNAKSLSLVGHLKKNKQMSALEASQTFFFNSDEPQQHP